MVPGGGVRRLSAIGGGEWPGEDRSGTAIVPIIDRSSANAFDDPEVAPAIIATGREELIFAGISLEVCEWESTLPGIGRAAPFTVGPARSQARIRWLAL
jgi:hypothetical protein